MSPNAVPDRARSFAFCVLAVIYFFFAQLVANHAANGLSSGDWLPLVERTILLFLLLVGYGAMGRAFEGQRRPLEAMGLTLRPGWKREFGLGAALGWGMLIASILPMVLLGGLIVTVWTSPRQFFILILDLVILAIASLAEEVAFRGYPFQRLVEAIGPVLATLAFSVFFGLVHLQNPSASAASVTITIFAGWLLSAAYLRTRALWFSWGWHFAWNVSMGVIFGLPISGITRFSPIFQSNTIGPPWITGGDYGPEASTITAIVILVGIFVVFQMTRAYAYKYARPVVAPSGGLPVDVAVPSTLYPQTGLNTPDGAVAQHPGPHAGTMALVHPDSASGADSATSSEGGAEEAGDRAAAAPSPATPATEANPAPPHGSPGATDSQPERP
jgi:uncharacterized protein